MFNEQTKAYIQGLNDPELVEYVLTGQRMYEPDATVFARDELERRDISGEQMSKLRSPIVAKLALYDARNPAELTNNVSSDAIICRRCGLEAPNRYVEYHQNMGALVMRYTSSVRGHLCKRCNRKAFWRCTLITLFLGWWGLTSFFLTIGFLIGNLITFLQTLSLEPVPPTATRPSYDPDVAKKVASHASLVSERLIGGIPSADIAREIASLAGVTPGQAWFFVESMRQQSVADAVARFQAPQSLGFPVKMVADSPQ